MATPLSATRNTPVTFAASAVSETVPCRLFRNVNQVFSEGPPAAVVSRTNPPADTDIAMLAPSTAKSFAPASGASHAGAPGLAVVVDGAAGAETACGAGAAAVTFGAAESVEAVTGACG